ncbi:MAG: hypothetical protein GYA22_11325, partial [Bacteroidales bacterium]|nr:hypothetical protein [Bacteroidales bacterium]
REENRADAGGEGKKRNANWPAGTNTLWYRVSAAQTCQKIFLLSTDTSGCQSTYQRYFYQRSYGGITEDDVTIRLADSWHPSGIDQGDSLQVLF